MDSHLARYIFLYCRQFMTQKEMLANRHLTGTVKVTGRTDAAAQQEAKNGPTHLRTLLSEDPEILQLVRDGLNAFIVRTAQRIMAAHSNELRINRCPECGNVARTPKARQCRFCRHDWHES